MKKLHFYVMSIIFMLTHVISFAQTTESSNPYAIFGGDPYVVGTEKQPNAESVFVITNPDKNTDVALLSHNPQKGTVTLFDKQGNVLNEVRLSDNDKAWTTIDPKASEYYATSPYAYCLNSPVRFIDPNGEDIYMYFYVNGHNKPEDDAMFWSAALTRTQDLLKNGTIKEGDAYFIQSISNIGSLNNAVSNIVSEYSPQYGQTAEFGLWSHGALDGPMGSVATSGDFAIGNQMSPKGWGNIDFNWKNNGLGTNALFFGCRTASNEGGSATPWVQTISSNANMENVQVYGQTMKSWPSAYPDAGVTTYDMRNGNHHAPTYMVGSTKKAFDRLHRMMGRGNQSYPMAVYQNGKFLRHQQQGYRK